MIQSMDDDRLAGRTAPIARPAPPRLPLIDQPLCLQFRGLIAPETADNRWPAARGRRLLRPCPRPSHAAPRSAIRSGLDKPIWPLTPWPFATCAPVCVRAVACAPRLPAPPPRSRRRRLRCRLGLSIRPGFSFCPCFGLPGQGSGLPPDQQRDHQADQDRRDQPEPGHPGQPLLGGHAEEPDQVGEPGGPDDAAAWRWRPGTWRYGMRSDPASGPAKIRSSAMNRPKNTAQTPCLVKTRSASATCPGPKCRGNLRPSQSNSVPAVPVADGEADRVSGDRPGAGGDRDPGRRQRHLVLGRQYRRGHQRDLAGNRDAQALHHDHQADDQVDRLGRDRLEQMADQPRGLLTPRGNLRMITPSARKPAFSSLCPPDGDGVETQRR